MWSKIVVYFEVIAFWRCCRSSLFLHHILKSSTANVKYIYLVLCVYKPFVVACS